MITKCEENVTIIAKAPPHISEMDMEATRYVR